METIEIRIKSFWGRLMNLIMGGDFPEDICSMRKHLILFILTLPLSWPILLWNTFASYDKKGKYWGAIIYYIISMILTIVTISKFTDKETGVFFLINENITNFLLDYSLILFYISSLFTATLFIIVAFLIIFIIVGLIAVFKWLFGNITVRNVPKELYKSWKEKYCKKITWL